MNYYSMDHRGGLDEALKTVHEMEKSLFDALVNAGFYKFYAFDERINAKRYILQNMQSNIGFPVWLLESEVHLCPGF